MGLAADMIMSYLKNQDKTINELKGLMNGFVVDGNIIKKRLSVRGAGRSLGIDSSCISKVLTGKRHFTGGYRRIYG